ncbi:Poltergeist like 1 isoform 1 [Hibiscus syriacus]|uniref:Poltergeist like 1 isoform 1 n=1 Tax=Hibiscus syriacus TaxID=106335 RepID=A0A6A2X8X4_HIBSY|nr:Poltergeist like 1 isoform 1 [Hibiscus syriacus]
MAYVSTAIHTRRHIRYFPHSFTQNTLPWLLHYPLLLISISPSLNPIAKGASSSPDENSPFTATPQTKPTFTKTPSLSEQLRPLSTTTLPNKDQARLLSKPKSTWVNPTKPKRSVLSLQRQTRSLYAHNPKVRELKLFAKRLSDCSEDAFITTKNLFPIETIFYNVTMKSLRFGRQFELIVELANEMVEEVVGLYERGVASCWRPDPIAFSVLAKMYGEAGDYDDVGLVEEAEQLFVDMKQSRHCRPDSWSFTCLGKAGRIDELVRVFYVSVQQGIKPDDRLRGCLLSVVSRCESKADIDKVLACMQQANPRLVAFVRSISDEEYCLDTVKEEFKDIISELKMMPEDRLHNKTANEWFLDVRSLSVSAAQTALEEWMGTLAKTVNREEALPELFSAQTGTGTHKFSEGLSNSFASHFKKLAAPLGRVKRKLVVLWQQGRI